MSGEPTSVQVPGRQATVIALVREAIGQVAQGIDRRPDARAPVTGRADS